MSTDTIQRRLDNVIGSIESRTWLVGQYISESAKDPQAITRSILPFRVYRSRQGELVLDGHQALGVEVGEQGRVLKRAAEPQPK